MLLATNSKISIRGSDKSSIVCHEVKFTLVWINRCNYIHPMNVTSNLQKPIKRVRASRYNFASQVFDDIGVGDGAIPLPSPDPNDPPPQPRCPAGSPVTKATIIIDAQFDLLTSADKVPYFDLSTWIHFL